MTFFHPPHPRHLLIAAGFGVALFGCAQMSSSDHHEAKPGAERHELGARPLTVSVDLAPGLAAEAAPAGGEAEYVLRLTGARLPADRPAVVHVFRNFPQADAGTSTDDPGFLGYFTLVPRRPEGGGGISTPGDITVAVRGRLKDLVGADGRLAVTLVPVAADGKAPARPLELSFDKIVLEPVR
jgi:hypothetical protein